MRIEAKRRCARNASGYNSYGPKTGANRREERFERERLAFDISVGRRGRAGT